MNLNRFFWRFISLQPLYAKGRANQISPPAKTGLLQQVRYAFAIIVS